MVCFKPHKRLYLSSLTSAPDDFVFTWDWGRVFELFEKLNTNSWLDLSSPSESSAQITLNQLPANMAKLTLSQSSNRFVLIIVKQDSGHTFFKTFQT